MNRTTILYFVISTCIFFLIFIFSFGVAYGYAEGDHVYSLWGEICTFIGRCGFFPFGFIFHHLHLLKGDVCLFSGSFLDSVFYSFLFLLAWRLFKKIRAVNEKKQVEN